MSLKFGTSGVRGLVTEMTDQACHRYGLIYARYLKESAPDTKTVILGGDHRSSTDRIMAAVALALEDEGLTVENAAKVPTPTIAIRALETLSGAIMVTGSHIPEDRNGIKFYMPWGEILKPDEQAMSKALAILPPSHDSRFDEAGMLNKSHHLPKENLLSRKAFLDRYLNFFPGDCLKGLRLVVYQHSTVLRELYLEIFKGLGAEVIPVGWSDTFVPVDTEAVDAPEQLKAWTLEHEADALISADGDGDRPLLVNEKGEVIRGDILGILASQKLNAKGVASPVSCNTALEACGTFPQIQRSRIGSPFVIAAMEELQKNASGPIVGYEANGGYLTGSPVTLQGCKGALSPLPTRDAVLPILAVLFGLKGATLSSLQKALPQRITDGLLLRGVDLNKASSLLENLKEPSSSESKKLEAAFGKPKSIDFTDGTRFTFETGIILHFRPSGNAPEFRCYIEIGPDDDLETLKNQAEEWLLSFIA
jgi:phosphomannomutase